MIKDKVLEKLDSVTNILVEHIREDYINMQPKNKDSNFYVKSRKPYYDIYEKGTNRCLYVDLCDIDFVRIIIKILDDKNFQRLGIVLSLENEYSKHINDMLYYVNSFKKTDDEIFRRVLEDRFQTSKNSALYIKRKLGTGIIRR